MLSPREIQVIENDVFQWKEINYGEESMQKCLAKLLSNIQEQEARIEEITEEWIDRWMEDNNVAMGYMVNRDKVKNHPEVNLVLAIRGHLRGGGK